jgi:hypothetical protein
MSSDKKSPFIPSDLLKGAVSNVISILEGLNPRDRGYAISRINALYGKKSAKPMAKKPANAAWVETPEYKAWQAQQALVKASGPEKLPPDDPRVVEMGRLRSLAFRKKSELIPPKGQNLLKASSGPAPKAPFKGTPSDSKSEDA